MRKIFEFKVFDLLNDKENEKFMNKVKKENPDLYSKFINILGNKGLLVAKEKYKQYDPILVKIESEREKEINKKNYARKYREKIKTENDDILNRLEQEISEIYDVISKSKLYDIMKIIKNDNRINSYFNGGNIIENHNVDFERLLKNPKELVSNLFGYFKIDSIYYKQKENYRDDSYILKISQYYNYNKKDLLYSITFDIYDYLNSNYSPKDDKNKDYLILDERNGYIQNLSKSYGVTYDDVIKKIQDFSYYLSDEFYEYLKVSNDMNKYNL